MILTKLQTLKGNVTASTRVSVQLVLLLATYNLVHDASSLLSIFESIQSGLLNNLIKSVISINISKIRASKNRRIVLSGCLKFVGVVDEYAAMMLIDSIIQCLVATQKTRTILVEEETDEEESATDTSYPRLLSILKHDSILKGSTSDPVIELVNTLKQRSGLVPSLTLQQQEYVRSIGC